MRTTLVFLLLTVLFSAPAIAQSIDGDWEYTSMTSEGKLKQFDGNGKPWLELRNGQWSLMLSGRLSGGGIYTQQGKKLIMKYDDGSLYGDFDVVLTEPKMTLTGVGETEGFDLGLQRVK
jgi:hypothetical protein